MTEKFGPTLRCLRIDVVSAVTLAAEMREWARFKAFERILREIDAMIALDTKEEKPMTKRPPLLATDLDLKRLVQDARNTREMRHPLNGNYLADALDALVALADSTDPGDRLNAADTLMKAAQAIHDGAETEFDAAQERGEM